MVSKKSYYRVKFHASAMKSNHSQVWIDIWLKYKICLGSNLALNDYLRMDVTSISVFLILIAML